ncbi:Protein kinase, partial [Ceratobasidium sp. 392]
MVVMTFVTRTAGLRWIPANPLQDARDRARSGFLSQSPPAGCWIPPYIQGDISSLLDQWTKLLTSSGIAQEDYKKNPQAVLEVLEFYANHQKCKNEEVAGIRQPMIDSGGKSSVGPPRLKVGTGLAGTGTETLPPGLSQARDHQSGGVSPSLLRDTRATPPTA